MHERGDKMNHKQNYILESNSDWFVEKRLGCDDVIVCGWVIGIEFIPVNTMTTTMTTIMMRRDTNNARQRLLTTARILLSKHLLLLLRRLLLLSSHGKRLSCHLTEKVLLRKVCGLVGWWLGRKVIHVEQTCRSRRSCDRVIREKVHSQRWDTLDSNGDIKFIRNLNTHC